MNAINSDILVYKYILIFFCSYNFRKFQVGKNNNFINSFKIKIIKYIF